MSTKTTSLKLGFPFFTILGLIFLTLKLAGIGTVASWSYWLVLLPFYGPFVLVFSVLVIMFSVLGILSYITNRK